jgi:hypothetical protein
VWKDCSDPQVTFGLSFSPKISRQARHLKVLMDMTAILFIEIILSNIVLSMSTRCRAGYSCMRKTMILKNIHCIAIGMAFTYFYYLVMG